MRTHHYMLCMRHDRIAILIFWFFLILRRRETVIAKEVYSLRRVLLNLEGVDKAGDCTSASRLVRNS